MTSAAHEGQSGEPSERDPLLGRLVAGKYRVEVRVGEGAMGVVYRVTHVTLERTLALKVLRPAFAKDQTFRTRFLREARAASRLEHPNSVAVVDFGEEPDGVTYLVMEYLDGHSLFDALVEAQRLEPAYAVRVMTQVLAALAVAHDAGVVHRDLKPENIMLVTRYADDGARNELAKVADFGIASVADARGALATHSGQIAGTPEYMSPEQGAGLTVDGRSDLYACGVVLYELVTGAVPFEGDSAMAVMLKHMNDPVVPPSAHVGGLPPSLERVILRALEKDPAKRFSDARAMRAALCACLDEYERDSRGAAHDDCSLETVLLDEGDLLDPYEEVPRPATGAPAVRTVPLSARVESRGRRLARRPFVQLGAALLLTLGLAAGAQHLAARGDETITTSAPMPATRPPRAAARPLAETEAHALSSPNGAGRAALAPTKQPATARPTGEGTEPSARALTSESALALEADETTRKLPRRRHPRFHRAAQVAATVLPPSVFASVLGESAPPHHASRPPRAARSLGPHARAR